jgi:hypothetical protein
MALALACFFAYAVNVLIGKAVVSLHWTAPRLGDVAEFLVVVAGVVLFVFALITDESASESSAQLTTIDRPTDGNPQDDSTGDRR